MPGTVSCCEKHSSSSAVVYSSPRCPFCESENDLNALIDELKSEIKTLEAEIAILEHKLSDQE